MSRIDHATALAGEMEQALGPAPAAMPPGVASALTVSDGGPAGVFLMSLLGYLQTVAKQAIDTPEERQRLKAAVLGVFDTYAAPRLPPMLAMVLRLSLDSFVTNALETAGA